jgi:hypothetical protein
MKFGTEIDPKLTETYVQNIVCKSTVTNMVMVQNFEVIYDKFNVDRICT